MFMASRFRERGPTSHGDASRADVQLRQGRRRGSLPPLQVEARDEPSVNFDLFLLSELAELEFVEL